MSARPSIAGKGSRSIPPHSSAAFQIGRFDITRHPVFTAIPFFTRHPIFYPSSHFYRHSGASRNLAPPPYSTFRRRNGPPAKPPEKSAIFSDATLLPIVHKCGTLAPASSATRPRGVTLPQKPTRPPKYTATRRTANPTRQKASGVKSGNHLKKPGSGQHGQNRRYCNHRRIRHALRSIPRGCVRPRRGRSHRSMPVQQWAGAWKTRTRNLASKIALAVAPTA